MGQAGADGRVIWITGWEGRENDVRSRAMGRASGREGGGLDLTTGDQTTDIGGMVHRRMRTVAIVTGVLGLNRRRPNKTPFCSQKPCPGGEFPSSSFSVTSF